MSDECFAYGAVVDVEVLAELQVGPAGGVELGCLGDHGWGELGDARSSWDVMPFQVLEHGGAVNAEDGGELAHRSTRLVLLDQSHDLLGWQTLLDLTQARDSSRWRGRGCQIPVTASDLDFLL